MIQPPQRVDHAVGYPAADEWQLMWDMSKTLLASGFLPRSIDRPEKVVTIMLKGRELGWPPMRSFQHIHVIEGKPALSAEAMLALIYEKVPGAVVHVVETTNDICVINAARPGRDSTLFKFSIQDAQRAGLMGKGVWKSYPRAMLRSRCVSEMARAVFPDALMGCSYTPEELDAEVNESGDIIDVRVASKGASPAVAAPALASAAAPSPSEPAPQPAVATKRQPAVYSRHGTQEKDLQAILQKRDVPSEIWGDIEQELLGKPFTALSTIVPAARARFESYIEAQREPAADAPAEAAADP